MLRAATDVGGTFTDFALYNSATRKIEVAKTSSKQTIIEAIGDCFEKSSVDPAELDHFIHGNTVAINIAIERKGAKTGLLTTAGFRDILELGRGNIRNSFDLMFRTPVPLVSRDMRREVKERMRAGGVVHAALDRDQAQGELQALLDDGVESIAICLLHSYANPEHEEALKQLVEQHNVEIFVTASSDLIRQYREFERTSTTVLNAYVGPRCGAFYDDLRAYLNRTRFNGSAMVMQSSGGTMTVETAKAQPVRTMESGPVGGTIAAAYVGKRAGFDNVVAFDMGGTTAKVSIVRNGRVEIADGYTIGTLEMGYPMQLPVVDILEVGSGGGSIAHLDETGLLKVGPVSAGAVPGPACYGRGGTQATVTDADLVLGRLNPDYFLGGEIHLDEKAAKDAVERSIAEPLGLAVTRAASGISRVADTDMSHAVRIMTVQRGHDPREFVLVAYGGAGPSHAVAVARELGIRRVAIPPYPGVFSAVGMLLADAREDNVLSFVYQLGRLEPEELERQFLALEDRGRAAISEAGFRREDMQASRALEMRYVGQEFTLVVELPEEPESFEALRARFDELHDQRYGHAFKDAEVEVVSLRSHVAGLLAKPDIALGGRTAKNGSAAPSRHRQVYFEPDGFQNCAVYRRDELPVGARFSGPAVIEEVMSTTVVHPGDSVEVDDMGNLIIDIGA